MGKVNMENKVLIKSSWDDGSSLDFRIAELLLKYNISGTFYIPTYCNRKGLSDNEIKELSDMGFEIGGHTVNHPEDIKLIKGEALDHEIVRNKEYLEDIIGKRIVSFCYPSGRYNEETIDAVKRAGYLGARTTLVGSIDESKDPYKIKTSVHIYPNRAEYDGIPLLTYAKRKFDDAKLANGVFHMFGHSWEIEKFGLWKELEELLIYIKENL